jgi:hypothetical protein
MATPEEVETMRTHITQLMEQNEALQVSMETIQQQQHQKKEDSHYGDLDEPEPQTLSVEIWNEPVPEGFKSSSLSSFDGKGDPGGAHNFFQHPHGHDHGP